MRPIARIFSIAVSALVALAAFAGCMRRPLMDLDGETALIPVKIDWSQSNIDVSEDDPTGSGLVHRVSLRFFPEDGSPVFERYLEGNIFEGTVRVPVGRYDVVVMNESVSDVLYWEDAMTFSDVDDFDSFAATLNPMPAEDMASEFPFYRPEEGENTVVEPFSLASWSMEGFEVTEEMATRSVASRAGGTPDALTGIVMRCLTYDVNVSARMINLVSAQRIHLAAKGFARKVFIASARTAADPSVYLFMLGPSYAEPGDKNGTASRSYLSFGRVPTAGARYGMSMDILLTDGVLYTDDAPLLFDVTGQVEAGTGTQINIDLTVDDSIDLPEVEGGIAVDDWDDDQITLN